MDGSIYCSPISKGSFAEVLSCRGSSPDEKSSARVESSCCSSTLLGIGVWSGTGRNNVDVKEKRLTRWRLWLASKSSKRLSQYPVAQQFIVVMRRATRYPSLCLPPWYGDASSEKDSNQVGDVTDNFLQREPTKYPLINSVRGLGW